MASNSDLSPKIEDLQDELRNDTTGSENPTQHQDVQIIEQTNPITNVHEMKKLVNK